MFTIRENSTFDTHYFFVGLPFEGKVDIENKDQYLYRDKKGKVRSKLDKRIQTQDDKDFELFKKDYWKQREKEFS